MIEVNIEETSEFNRVVTSMLEEMIRISEFSDFEGDNIVSVGFDELLENITIQNIMSTSMNEESEKVLIRNEDVELIFKDDRYIKNEQENNCCVCLMEIEHNEYIHSCHNCNNINHFNCMNEWLKRKVECPICRQSFEDQVIIKDHFHKFIEQELDI